jgi:hypothetical protein
MDVHNRYRTSALTPMTAKIAMLARPEHTSAMMIALMVVEIRKHKANARRWRRTKNHPEKIGVAAAAA